MIIEINRPEIEALIQHRLKQGGFTDPQDVIAQALRATESASRTGADLIAALQASPYREVELEPAREDQPVRPVSL